MANALDLILSSIKRKLKYHTGDSGAAWDSLVESLQNPIPIGTASQLERGAAMRMQPGSLRPNLTNQEIVNAGLNIVGMAPIGMTVYHGSPHKFDKFDMSKIGTGEGAQAYGHGLYMAESPDVARKYLNAGEPDNLRLLSKESREALGMPEPSLYKVDIPDESIPRMLDWDKPMSEQAPHIRQALGVDDVTLSRYSEIENRLIELMRSGKLESGEWYVLSKEARGIREKLGFSPTATGEDAYRALTNANMAPHKSLGGDREYATQYLNGKGIPGIRYLDGVSRGAGEGTSNFVLFDDQLPRILEVNGQPTGLKPWAEDVRRPTNAQGQPIPPTRYELAHAEAQRVAALPVEQGGLGLPANNTAMDRARAMDYDKYLMYPGRYVGPRKAMSDPDERLFLRYGDLPEDGISRHVQHGRPEVGTSVMSPLDELSATSWSPQMMFSMTAGEMGTRPLNVVKGKQIGINDRPYFDGMGSDGEPIIENASHVRPATDWERYSLVRDMENVSKQYGYSDDRYDMHKLLNSEKPNYEDVFMTTPDGKLRSRFAAFNPANRDSADLLAGLGLPLASTSALLSLIYGQDDAQASELQRMAR